MSRPAISVLKLGSSVLRGEHDLPRAVSEIYRSVRDGRKVIAVVSAFGDTTNGLLAAARRMIDTPPAEPLAALLATGETRSAALLTLALHRAGIPARLVDPVQLRLRLRGPLLDGEPISLDCSKLLGALQTCSVAVLPGFFGLAEDGGLGLLGRGGSDLTALFAAHQLSADACRLLKDVPGIYVKDPASSAQRPERYRTLSFETAAKLEARVLQSKATRFALRVRRSFEVAALGDEFATRIGAWPDSLERSAEVHAPLRVGLLGLGTVGFGVYTQLRNWPERFDVVGAVVRDVGKDREGEVPRSLLQATPQRLLELAPDLIVEAMGGRQPAAGLLAAALHGGCHVVTANKAVIAEHGAGLTACAAAGGAQLRFSAAVGGGVPVLEEVRRLAGTTPLRSVSGVLNGTCNFVLDRLAEGTSFPEAVRAAQRQGLAEADPGDDLGGIDSARKLALVCHEAFGIRLRVEDVRLRGIADLDASAVRQARAAGRVFRLVATCERGKRGVRATVEPRQLSLRHPLGRCRDEENRVLIEPEHGSSTLLTGKGAGRWPTSESVLGDVLELSRLTGPRAQEDQR